MTQINLYSETLSREIRSLTKSIAREPSNGARRWRMNSPLSWQRLQGGSHERFECPREILELKLYWSSSRDLGFGRIQLCCQSKKFVLICSACVT